MSETNNIATFGIPDHLLPFAQDTVDRLAYLFPAITFCVSKTGIECSSSTDLDRAMLTQEIRYGLARQKIRVEGQLDRTALYAALFQ